MHWMCHKCDRDYSSRRDLIEHFEDSPVHHYCTSCDLNCANEVDLEEHFLVEHYYCRDCTLVSHSFASSRHDSDPYTNVSL